MMFKLTKLMCTILCAVIIPSHADTPEKTVPLAKVTSATKQGNMTPLQALDKLKQGNQRFLDNKLIKRDYLAQAKNASYGQFPWAVVLNCMDSRSVPEFIFDQGLADLFTLRVAGNIVNNDILGSMEYATDVVGARLIVVMGHTSCGAVSGACDDVKLGHLTDVLDKIKPVVAPTQKETGISDCKNPKLIDAIAKDNALHVAYDILDKSSIIRGLVEKEQIGIVTAMHDIKTGEVTFYQDVKLIH